VSTEFRAAVLLLAVLPQASAFAQSNNAEPLETLAEVVVVGSFPGPPLWKVSKDGHALWILPLVDMYPKKMQWESARVEKLIGESQEYISRPVVASGIYTSNPLLLVWVLSLYNTMVHLPGEKTLADVLPPDVYQRFRAVKSRYFPRNSGIEKLAVSGAARAMQKEILQQENLESLNMTSANSPLLITEQTDKWVKGNKAIRRTKTGVGLNHKLTARELKALAATMKVVAATPAFVDAEAACFEKILAYFENDLGPVKRRANAWARGRIDDLVNPTPLYSVRNACINPFSANADFPEMKKLLENEPGLAAPDLVELGRKSRQQWLDAAEAALSRNTTTFALLFVNDVLDKDGLVAQLESKGYKVEISAE